MFLCTKQKIFLDLQRIVSRSVSSLGRAHRKDNKERFKDR